MILGSKLRPACGMTTVKRLGLIDATGCPTAGLTGAATPASTHTATAAMTVCLVYIVTSLKVSGRKIPARIHWSPPQSIRFK